MQKPIEISYRGVAKSDEIETLVRDKAARLDKFCDHVSRCDVIIEQPNHAQHSGSPFRVRIDVTVPPHHELVADEKPTKHEMHEPLTKVIGDAFRSMERQLKELTARQHHKVKTHEDGGHALVSKLFAADGYGFITDLQGRDVYFHRDSLKNGDFDRLKVGTEVRFDEVSSEKGAHATSVHIVSTGGSRL